MKTKQEILAMDYQELVDYKASSDLDSNDPVFAAQESDGFCAGCFYCRSVECTRCIDCAHCFLCRDAKNLQYAICNVELSKAEYEAKMIQLGK